MPYVYRRPFDYPQHRQAFNLWQLAGAIEATTATASFTTYPASVSSTAVAEQSSRSVRFASQGIFRRRWPYAVQQTRINLFYTDAVEIQATQATADFTTYAADVRLGSSSGATIDADLATAGFTSYTAEVLGGRRDPISDAIGEFTTYPTTITATYGLGESVIGQVPAKGSANYTPGRLNIKGRSGSRRSPLRELVKRK